MSNELYISVTDSGERIALFQDKRLIEYHIEETEQPFAVGDLYLGTVKKVVAGMNAAFIDIGYDKDAFLHYHDLSPQILTLNRVVKDAIAKRPVDLKSRNFKFEKEIDKFGKIADVLNKNQAILVQVVKEPISSKGPRLSCDISIAGRYVVLVPFGNAVNISKKITNKVERTRLHKLVSSVKSANFGVIVRTVAENKSVEELEKDLLNCIEKWDLSLLKLREAKPRDRILSELGRASSILRDMLNANFDSIVVDTKPKYDELKTLLHSISPEQEKILKLHAGKNKMFEQFGVEKHLKSLFGRSVSLAGGGYLVIEHTEALHVIDVNSGNKSTTEEDQEGTALHTNIEAAKEIARQLRLRDMGGIIVVDFIDMRKPDNRKKIQDAIRDEMKADRSKYTILPLSKFGLLQITRQRVRPEMNVAINENCPTCHGTGSIQASIAVTDTLEGNLDYIMTRQNENGITVFVHPFLYAYYTKGLISKQLKMYFKYKKRIRFMPDSSLGIVNFYFLNGSGEKIELQ